MSNNSESNAATNDTVRSSQAVNLSVGSGIAISGIWIRATGLTIFAVLFLLTDIIADNAVALKDASEEAKGEDKGGAYVFAFIFYLAIAAIPLFTAYGLTKKFLGEDE